MKNAVFWDVAPCRYCVNRHFGGPYRLHSQGRRKKKTSLLAPAHAGSSFADFLLLSSTLKMEAIRASEMSVNTISTRPHIPEDGFFHWISWLTFWMVFFSACEQLQK
jgi:hypothetical protein